jgi:hypothetical protein
MTDNSQHLRTTCPFCGYHHDRITPNVKEEVFPENGDASMCWSCGAFCILDDTNDLGMRKPNKKEQRLMDREPRIAHMRKAWRMVKAQ